MASGNTNFNTNYNTTGHMTQTGSFGTTSEFGHTLGGTTTQNIDKTSTFAHPSSTTGSTLGHTTGSTLGHTTGSTFGTTSGSTLETTSAPSLSSTSTMGHTTGHTTTGLKEGEHASKATGLKDEFVGGMKESTGTMFGSQKLKAEGHEQKILGKEEVAAAKAQKGIVGEKGTIGTAEGAKAFDEADKEKMKFDKKAEKDQLKADKKAAKERAKAEKQSEKEHAKADKEHGKLGKGHKLDKGHEKTTEPAHTEPFVGRVDRLNANFGNPHVEPHVAAMMTHGLPVESHIVTEQPIATGVSVEKPITTTTTTTSYEKPFVGGAYQQKDMHEKAILERPMPGVMKETFTKEEVIKPRLAQDMPSSQKFTAEPTSGLGTNFDRMKLDQGSSFNKPMVSGAYEQKELHEKTVLDKPLISGDRLNVSPRAERLNVSPRSQNLNVSPRHCTTGRLETSPRHMAQV